ISRYFEERSLSFFSLESLLRDLSLNIIFASFVNLRTKASALFSAELEFDDINKIMLIKKNIFLM
ncbi:MAG: hypothetical protein ACOVK2_04585, partial [Candidatus Fonsibacter sp.]